MAGRRRAAGLAARLGTALRDARLRLGLSQRVVAERAGVSQSFVSQAERGLGGDGSVETWSSLAAAVGLQLASYLELAPGATAPRDIQHLGRQQEVVRMGAAGSWTGQPEFRVRTADGVDRFIDVLLDRATRREAVVVEIVDWIADLGEDLRGLQRKVDAIRAMRPGWRVAGLLVIRATARNRAVVRGLSDLLGSRFTSGAAWLRALRTDAALPEGDGILWAGSQSVRLSAIQLPGRVSARSAHARPHPRSAAPKRRVERKE
jgi:transcriptional regulator with XRE-family HTH domain